MRRPAAWDRLQLGAWCPLLLPRKLLLPGCLRRGYCLLLWIQRRKPLLPLPRHCPLLKGGWHLCWERLLWWQAAAA